RFFPSSHPRACQGLLSGLPRCSVPPRSDAIGCQAHAASGTTSFKCIITPSICVSGGCGGGMPCEHEDEFGDDKEAWERVNALRHAGLGDEALQLARSVQGAAQTDALSFIWHIRIGNLLWTRYHRPEEAASEFRAACRIKPADELA